MKIVYPDGKIKALTFSYDDNQIFDRRLIEILNQYGLCGTFHVNAGRVGFKNEADAFITWEELPELYKGHEVSCHGLNHPYFTRLPKGKMLYEISEDKRQLESAVHYVVRGMSYPFGEYSGEVIQVMEAAGMEYSRTVESTGSFIWPGEFMKWHPTCHHNAAFQNNKLLDRFINASPYSYLPLFYIWGHSFEFDRENTWGEMEELCRQLSGHEDIWYASNIQIKDYICAVRKLVYSADQSMIYNPTAVKVYVEHNDSLFTILPGETFYV